MKRRFGTHGYGKLVARCGAAAVVIAGTLPPATAVELLESAAADRLTSILVATRRAEPTDPAGPTRTLEPISTVSDFEPELADPVDESAPAAKKRSQSRAADESEDTTTRRAQFVKPKRARVAARVVNPATPAGDRSKRVIASDTPDAIADVRPAKFNGVLPGYTTEKQLTEKWGQPVRQSPARGELTGDVLTYEMKPFHKVEALVDRSLVRVVRVTLAEPADVVDLERKLKLAAIDSVDVVDPDSRRLLGVSYPEKGLTLLTGKRTDAGPAKIAKLVIEPLESKAFTLRAENRSWRQIDSRLADLAQAIEMDAKDAHAWWLKSLAHLDAGQAADAEKAAERATELRPGSAAYRLAHARALVATGKVDRGVLTTRKVLDDGSASQLVRAQAMHDMGSLASLGGTAISNKAIGFHTKAVELADEVVNADDPRVRKAARVVLIDAHLAIAKEIARRDYSNRDELVADWIGRASGLAEAAIESEEGGMELRLRVANKALAALASMRPTKDPSPWITEAEETATTILGGETEPLLAARVAWELGEAYHSAVRVEHTRGEDSQALKYGAKAIERLSAGAEPRVSDPGAERLVGELYFYLGAVNAVHRDNHGEAIGWYDKARPMLSDTPGGELYVPRRTGEMLVSMGVSYWQEDRHDLAIDVTERGAQVMQKAINAGVLERSALTVPYGNLAAMHRALGESEQAARYTQMIEEARETKRAAVAVEAPVPQEPTVTPVAARQTTSQRQADAEPAPPRPRRHVRRHGAGWSAR